MLSHLGVRISKKKYFGVDYSFDRLWYLFIPRQCLCLIHIANWFIPFTITVHNIDIVVDAVVTAIDVTSTVAIDVSVAVAVQFRI